MLAVLPAIVFSALQLSQTVSAEITLALLVFSRHGDRSAKLFPPTHITNLGLNQAHSVGSSYRAEYIAAGAPKLIVNVSQDEWDSTQIYAAAPDEETLVNTGIAWLQGLYPPDATDPGAGDLLANGTTVIKPLGGYQYAWLHGEDADAPEAIWLKGDVLCPAYVNASQTYAQSEQFAQLSASTKSFYESFAPILEGIFPFENLTYAHAYDIFDVLNVGVIHNETIRNNITADQLFQLRTLADGHEFALTFNASQPARSIPAQTFIGKMLAQLNQTLTTPGGPKLSLLVASYNTMQAFFALTNLTVVSPDFFGIPDYASTLAFELVTNASAPVSPADVSVRFLFRNGSADDAPLRAFPLFGSSDELTPWSTFSTTMSSFAISTPAQWCSICGAAGLQPFCPVETTATPFGSARVVDMSNSVAGVIGAMVTLGLLSVVAVIAAFLGIRVNRRQASAARVSSPMHEKLGSDTASA